MVVRILDVNNDPYRPQEKFKEPLGPEVPYLNTIGALMYLANYTWPNISFAINLLARYSFSPTRIHWNGVKCILHYVKGTTGKGLFYSNVTKLDLISYADTTYLSNPHNGILQTWYLFTCGGTTIPWQSMKQTITATSTNHA